ncbi:MAG: AzlC family ABC transporter permease [Clostridia bacterium]|nr:AzlC family ABC transporter permease [Clostridia bacterium]
MRNLQSIKEGAAAAVPVVIGYIPTAMAFGLLAKTVEVPLLYSFLFSAMVFAGASQFMALNLIKSGVLAGEIILATFLINLRHFLMSASLAARLKEKKKVLLSIIAFGITDEVFSVAATMEKKPDTTYLLTLQGITYSSWVGGTVLGYLIGAILPASVQSSMGIALYAMFVAILVPEMRKSIYVAVLAIGAGTINWLLTWLNLLPSGWNMIVATVTSALAGAMFFSEDSREGIT